MKAGPTGTARSETLTEIVQFRGNFRVFYPERHRGDLDVRPGFWNSNAYQMNTIDQPASSSTQETSARKSAETEL